jgi:NAD(P)-dependent dehydrogenase (short-subunit alcohol dehydrogenase family)
VQWRALRTQTRYLDRVSSGIVTGMMRGKTALITGSTDGLGRQVALRLAESGFRVLVHGRDRERGKIVEQEVRAAGGSAHFLDADFASLAAVRELSERVMRESASLELLINNAGIGTGPRASGRATSVDGYELRFAVNYLAGFLLTDLLLPLLVKSAPAQIVHVASAGQYPLDFTNVMLTRAYSGMRAYAQSKLAQVMFTFDLAQQLTGTEVAANCLHPASLMDTRMVRETGTQPTSTVEEGTRAVMALALSPQGQTGMYLNGTQPARAHEQAYEEAARARLRILSRELAGLGPR